MSRLVLFYGSRTWRWPGPIAEALDDLEPGDVVLNGGAPGADRMSALAAERRGIHVATVRALWDYYGRRHRGGKNPAGPLRNRAMAVFPIAYANAFRVPGRSPGTDDMTRVLSDLGVPVTIHLPPGVGQ